MTITKERVEELKESMRKSVYAGTLDSGDAENIAAILDDCAERTAPGPTDADEREMQDLDTGTALLERMIQLLRHIRSSSGVSVESGEEGKK